MRDGRERCAGWRRARRTRSRVPAGRLRFGRRQSVGRQRRFDRAAHGALLHVSPEGFWRCGGHAPGADRSTPRIRPSLLLGALHGRRPTVSYYQTGGTVTIVRRDGNSQLRRGTHMARLNRSVKRGVLLTLLVVVLSSIVAPSPGLAFTPHSTGHHLVRPSDGVGDSPLVP